MSRWFRHHVVEAMPGHMVGWIVGGAIVAVSGVSPDDWVANFVHATSEFLPHDWSAATSAMVARSSFAAVGVAILAATLLLGRRAKEQSISVTSTAPVPTIQLARAPELALPDKPSIAVLPFQNLSGDLQQDYFCDGMVEDITAALSRMKWLFVIARNSSFTYKGKLIDIKQVGRELGVRYVLEGSVRKSGNRLRLTGQLIDAGTGTHIWADRFEGELADIFDLQDKITASVVGAIEPALTAAEIHRAQAKPTGSLDAYDYFLRALAQYHSFTAAGWKECFVLCCRAVDIDPQYAAAYGLAAYCLLLSIVHGWETDTAKRRAEMIEFARKSVELGKADPTASWRGGRTLFSLGETERGVGAVQRSLELDPNSAGAWTANGFLHWDRGEPRRAIEHFERAMRLSPRDPEIHLPMAGIGLAYFAEHRYDEAIKWSDAALGVEPGWSVSLRCKAASLALLGRLSEARAVIDKLLVYHPGTTLASVSDSIFLKRTADSRATLLDGLRKAGLPE